MQRELPIVSIEYTFGDCVIGDQKSLWWKGQFTDGECSCRGTRLYLRQNAALARCSDCDILVPCDYATNELTKCADTWSMRGTTVRELIEQISSLATAADWLAVAFAVNTPCSCSGWTCPDWSPHWLNKEAVLVELQQVAIYCFNNNVYQNWI